MHTFLIAAISLDGFIAQTSDQVSTAWTSIEDKKFFSERTKAAGLLVLGSKTFQTFARLLPGRSMIVMTRDVSLFRAWVGEKKLECEVVEIDAATSAETLADFRDDRLYATSLSPKELDVLLSNAGIPELAVCGGTSIYTQYVQAGLVESMYVTVEPRCFGRGVPLFSEVVDHAWLELRAARQLSPNTLLLEYLVQKSSQES